MYAEVIVNLPQLNTPLDYEVPADLQARIKPGCLVEVPVGKQTMQSIVFALRSKSTVPNIRPLHDLLDPQPVLTPALMRLAVWLAKETLSPLPACLALMLPPGLSQQADTLYTLLAETEQNGSKFSPTQKKILTLLKQRGPLRGRQLQHAFKYQNWKASIQALQHLGVVKGQPVLPQPTTRKKTTPAVQLNGSFTADMQLSKTEAVQQRRMKVLQFLQEQVQATPLADCPNRRQPRRRACTAKNGSGCIAGPGNDS